MGRTAGRARPLSLARRLLSRSLPDRAEDQPVAHGDRAAALHARVRSGRGLGGLESVRCRAFVRELRLHRLRLALPRLLSQESRDRRLLDRAAAPDRLPARLWHRARAEALAARAVHAGRAAVLDVVSDPHLCVDQHPPARRPAEPGPARLAHRRRTARVAFDRYGGLHRHRLFLSPVHGAAASTRRWKRWTRR